MSILTANLKHLYQRRGLWLVYAFFIVPMFLVIIAMLHKPEAGKGMFTLFLLLAFIIGFITASLSIEVMNKPFSYCLPGHRKTVRQFIFLIGIAVSLLGSPLFLAYPGLGSWDLVLSRNAK
jgi:uncharacterized membrane protein